MEIRYLIKNLFYNFLNLLQIKKNFRCDFFFNYSWLLLNLNMFYIKNNSLRKFYIIFFSKNYNISNYNYNNFSKNNFITKIIFINFILYHYIIT